MTALDDLDPERLGGAGDGAKSSRWPGACTAESPDLIPSALLQRLSTMNAQLVTRIAAEQATPPASTGGRMRPCAQTAPWERERAALQREIDRLQDWPAPTVEIDALWQKKKALLQRIEELT